MSELITNNFLKKYQKLEVPWGYNGLGYIVYKRTYARKKPDGSLEEWPETIQRCINGAQDIGADYTQAEAEKLFDYMFNLKCSLAGRMLWQLGTEHIKRFGGNSLLNCWAVKMDVPEAFCFLFENLMLGGGVGFSVSREDVYQLPNVKEGVEVQHKNTNDADFIVPDSREGWVSLLRRLLKCFYITGRSFSFSTVLVRGYGEEIKGFGGKASGPGILVDGIKQIVEIFQNREGKKLRSLDVLDICNIIGSIVVSGNVRRSAQVAIGDPDDYLFLRAKRWDSGNIPNWRALSNNTIYADDYSHLSRDFWEGYNGNGEPYGLFNVKLAQKVGRLDDVKKDNGDLMNPCCEVVLANYECCNLSEVFLTRVESKQELEDIVKLLYKTQKAVCTLPFIHEETNKIVKKNMRIGVGMTGICQSFDKLEWLEDVYKKLRDFDEVWSKKKEYNESIRLTTVKPSGTLSLLAGVTPGVHPAFGRFFIRRVRISSDDNLVSLCKSLGYKVEYTTDFDGSSNHSTSIIEFPCFSGDNTIVAKDMTAIQQLELVKKMQTIWSDNSVSVTVYYKKEEIPAIKEWLKENYKNSIKSVSFLLHQEHGFNQAPYEEITKEQYDELMKNIKPIKKLAAGDDLDVGECAKGACPIK